MSTEKSKFKLFQPVMVVLPPDKLVNQVRLGMITDMRNEYKIRDVYGNEIKSNIGAILPFNTSQKLLENGFIVVCANDNNEILYWGSGLKLLFDSPEFVQPFKSENAARIAWKNTVDTNPELKMFDPVVIMKHEAIRRFKKRRWTQELNKLKVMLEDTGRSLLKTNTKRYNSYTCEELMIITAEIQLELDGV